VKKTLATYSGVSGITQPLGERQEQRQRQKRNAGVLRPLHLSGDRCEGAAAGTESAADDYCGSGGWLQSLYGEGHAAWEWCGCFGYG
jgi:hypothetical protein